MKAKKQRYTEIYNNRQTTGGVLNINGIQEVVGSTPISSTRVSQGQLKSCPFFCCFPAVKWF